MIAVAQGQVAGNLKRRFPCCAQGGQGRGGRGSAGFSGRLWPTRHQKRSWNQARRPAASIDAASQAAFTRTPREGSRPLPDAYRSRIPAQCGRACDAGRPGGRYGRTGCWTRRSTPPSAPPPTGCHSPGLSTSSTASYSRTVKAQPVEYSELARPRAGAIRLIGLCGSPVLSARKRLFCLRHQGSWETSRVRMSMFTSASFAVTWPGYSLWPTRRCCRTSRRKHGGPETLCRWRACLPSRTVHRSLTRRCRSRRPSSGSLRLAPARRSPPEKPSGNPAVVGTHAGVAQPELCRSGPESVRRSRFASARGWDRKRPGRVPAAGAPADGCHECSRAQRDRRRKIGHGLPRS